MKSRKTVDVSILSSNFNQAPFLDDYFQSILASTICPSQIVFIDDGSKDNSLEILEKYSSFLNIKLVIFDSNRGLTDALNEGIRIIDTPYVMRLDPDDFISPAKIEKQYYFIINNKNVSLLGTNAFYFNHKMQKVIFKSNLPTDAQSIQKLLKKGQIPVFHSSIMGHIDIFKNYPYQKDAYPAEDYDMFARIVSSGHTIMNLKENLLYYRIHKNNLSSKHLSLQVRRVHALTEKYFQKNTSKFSRRKTFLFFFLYKKAIETANPFRYFYLFLAALISPSKTIKRFFPNRCYIKSL